MEFILLLSMVSHDMIALGAILVNDVRDEVQNGRAPMNAKHSFKMSFFVLFCF